MTHRRPTGTRRSVTGLTIFSLVLTVLGGLAAGQNAPGAPAQVVDYEPPTRVERYAMTDFGRSPSPKDDVKSSVPFRVVERTGNCCENYLTAAKDGTIYDIGGSYINFTPDSGKTWQQVKPLEPLVNGEGAIAVAPNGDIVAVEWDPYSGDHLLAYKYTAETEEWQFLEMPLKTPFYDRPWLTVVPGPFTVNGTQVPYVVYVDGYPHRGPLLFSTDGLTYIQTSNPFIDQAVNPPVTDWLPTARGKANDWIVPNSQSPITPLGKGSAIAQPGPFANRWSILNAETLAWSPYSLPQGNLEGKYLVDSRGAVHNLMTSGQRFIYRISRNGGRTWKTLAVNLPKGHSSTGMQVDFRVNAQVGVAAVALHATAPESDVDLLYKLNIERAPKLTRLYNIGLGDINASSGVGQDIRFDFNTVVILPDGRLAVSFLDSSTGPIYHLAEAATERLGPAIAIEL